MEEVKITAVTFTKEETRALLDAVSEAAPPEDLMVPTNYLRWNHSLREYGPKTLDQLWVPRDNLNLPQADLEEVGEWREVPHYPE